MSNNQKPACQYGAKCYRKNRTHLKEYSHPTGILHHNQGKERGLLKNGNAQKKHDFGSTENTRSGSEEENEEKDPAGEIQSNIKRKSVSVRTKSEIKKMKNNDASPKGKEKITDNSSDESDTSGNDIKSNSWTYIKALPDPQISHSESSLNKTSDEDLIKSYFLVDMPSDFYSFFRFCKSVNQNEPLQALKAFGLILSGPYDILGNDKEKIINLSEKNLMLCHWRYYYDPPEFQTVLVSESGFHMGYWRDDPHDEPQLLASNNSQDCLFKIEGENIFGAVYNYLSNFIKNSTPFIKMEASKCQASLSKWAQENQYSLEKITGNIKKRERRINSKTFHGLGIVVPVQKKTEVGYRPLIETDANLKKICKLIMDADDESEQEALMEKLQPLITFANIANDECDFGNSLELGIDLFCMGSPVFHNLIEHLLTTAYSLLNRSEFGEIIQIHLKNRKKSNNLSII